MDRILKRKAEQGVKVYVIVYKEVTQTMSMSSKHTKVIPVDWIACMAVPSYLRSVQASLEALHPNISCMRHPDHIGSKG